MKTQATKIILVVIISLVNFCSISQDSIQRIPLVIGEQIALRSTLLEEERLLNIYLPASYHPDSVQRYPVIYLLDGSMDEDFLHIAGLVQFGNFPWVKLLPESIVVGIANVDRKRDFTFPTTLEQDKIDFPTTGGSVSFIQFLEEEVKPLITSRYRCSAQSTLIGQSLGGLLASEILLKHAHLFTQYIIVSPSLWWDAESLLEHELPVLQEDQKVFIAVGKEGEVMESDAQKLYNLFFGAHIQGQIGFHFFEEHDHADVLHQAVYKAFTFLYPRDPQEE